MSAGEPFLGALDGSRRVFAKERAKTASGTAYCTQKSLKFQDRTKHSRWRLAGVQAAAFSGADRSAKTGQFHLRASMLPRSNRLRPPGPPLWAGRLLAWAPERPLYPSGCGTCAFDRHRRVAFAICRQCLSGTRACRSYARRCRRLPSARCEQPAKEVNSIRPIRLRSLVGQHVAGSRGGTITRAHQRER